ncbi:6-methylsalicylic acid synthase [Trichoderma atroviride IMI 206040]|uniref:6-methylsalicylic acid synthase n=1 Tax=Hypocrea atroviridis (strain ATCC 20476 / IMI 206040) TaxID=452589 RepID=G9NQL7_HYPAI|nr:6-methylsalicylic acid synthase [Trichoderma atroviride IMI 206040]EHK46840.1 6-methylsalicylic acid synthase [Trichoderma atroviride IMI 206040]
MACRTAGGNTSPEKLWQFLLAKQDGCGEVPRQRWEPWLRRDSRNAKEISNAISKGYFIHNLENFDAAFFGISPKEAEQMDPHQRLGLELSWEALEDAGFNPESLVGSNTAVFMGVDSDDYSRLLLEDLPNIEPWMGIGSAPHGVANRISYHLDLMGPSTAVDAACASSLVAVHLGCRAIQNLESDVAIVGGVNVLLAPALTLMLGKAGALSPEGVCKSFDDEANGYGRGEGGAIIILKRLSRAIADGDNIKAILKGSAVAQDGKTNGIMAPNSKAQELVARQALAQAGVDPLSISYIEAHATATKLGDPTEMAAIAAVYGTAAGRSASVPVYIGSIKPSVGHMEAAAGAIGLVKAVLAVNKGELAPQTRLQKLNTRINWAEAGLKVVQETTKWTEEKNRPRRAAVCSYGYGGTVSHAIVEQFVGSNPEPDNTNAANSSARVLFLVSVPQEKRLAKQARAVAEWLTSPAGKQVNLVAVANTLAQRRNHHDYRLAFVADSHETAAACLEAAAEDRTAIGHYISKGNVLGVSSDHARAAVWIFSGHGAQWRDMGKELLLDTAFRQAIDPLDAIVQSEAGFSILEALATGDFLEMSERIQILTYVVQIGLSRVLMSKGLVPEAVIGHSVGEIAASVVAVADMNTQGTKAVRVKTDIAFHSPMLNQIVGPLEESLTDALQPRQPTLPIYSTSNRNARTKRLRDVNYWTNNMTGPVFLKSAVNAAADDGYRVFVEVSTHPILLFSANETLLDRGLDYGDMATLATMKRDTSLDAAIMELTAELYIKGVSIDFEANSSYKRIWCPSVPGTSWVHKPYYRHVETGFTGQGSLDVRNKHVLLGQRIVDPNTNIVRYTAGLSTATKPFPGKHPLDGTEIIPAAVYLNTFHQATGALLLSNVNFDVPVSLGSDEQIVSVVVNGEQISVLSTQPSSLEVSGHETWITHSLCSWSTIATPEMAMQTKAIDVSILQNRIGVVLPNSFATDYLARIGVEGIAFPWEVIEHYGNDSEMIAKVDMDPSVGFLSWDQESWAPILDAATSIGSAIFFNDPRMRIVSKMDHLYFYSSGSPPKIGYIYVQKHIDAKDYAADIHILDQQGNLLAMVQGMRLSDLVNCAAEDSGSLVHQLVWVPPAFKEQPRDLTHVIMVSSDLTLLEAYSTQLKNKVTRVTCRNRVVELSDLSAALSEKGTIVVYAPPAIESAAQVADATEEFIWQTASIVKALANIGQSVLAKFFVLTNRVFSGESVTSLAHGALYGLARIIASEHPDIWGGLIDSESSSDFPMLAIRYVDDYDILRINDGLPRRAIMRRLLESQKHAPGIANTLMPKPEGTYIVTGGLGDFGLETCNFLIEKGARNVVIVSRRGLPLPNYQSILAADDAKLDAVINRIRAFEAQGATIHTLALDITLPDAADLLLKAIRALNIPPVLGVVHAAGVLEDSSLVETTRDSFARVLAPKVNGALALHSAFPPGSLDFFIMYSSIGQLVGTVGQASYGSSNAFLDALATHRRAQGDNTVAFQFTAVRGLGMATGTSLLMTELRSKGITDITAGEAFRAWEHLGRYDVESAVVTRCLPLLEGEPAAIPLLEDIVVRRPRIKLKGLETAANSMATVTTNNDTIDDGTVPAHPLDREKWVDKRVRECVARVLMMDDIDDIGLQTRLSDLGLDSVMTVALRQAFQAVFKIKVPLTLTWSHPTLKHLVPWFLSRLSK